MARRSEIPISDRGARRRSSINITNNLPPSSSSSSSSSSKEINLGEDELIQTYVDQNRILAKRNAIYSTKITELENKLNQSNLENTRLRNTLLSLVTSIESNVMTNVNNILQSIQQSRITNGLPRNAQLDCLGQSERPETSTPLNSTSSTPAFNIEESTVKESKTNNYGVPQYFKRKSPEEKEELLEKFSTILEQSESDDLVTVANITTTTKNEDRTTWELPPASSESKLPLESTFNEKISVLQEDSEQTNTKIMENPSSSSSSSSGSQINSDEPISTLKSKSKTTKETKEKGKKPSSKTTKKSTSLVKTEEKPNTETVATEPVVTARASSEELPPRRPSRNRKEVSYKPLSMRAKMRRESIKMLDAVGDNVLINYSTSSKKRTNESQQQQEPKDPEEPQNKRKALSNITNTAKSTNKKRQSLDPFAQADLSIFDFQEDEKSQRNRRYTTIG
ncbi:hypothetical protein MG3_01941 [Candida albicans P78048]|uniref:Shugoshin C-terminal domain-containing protein n=1 Tax=Candida albicans P78048 TaxID=1094989 RepID=A0AB34PU59_CANAX|nr:hypothetical protein MG3_01941 [Candida albicans P78048]